MNCNSIFHSYWLQISFPSLFQDSSLTTKKDNPSFYFPAHYGKTVILGIGMNLSAAGKGEAEVGHVQEKWRKRREKREMLDEWDERIANHDDPLKISTSRMHGWKTSICRGLDTWQESNLLESVPFSFQKPKRWLEILPTIKRALVTLLLLLYSSNLNKKISQNLGTLKYSKRAKEKSTKRTKSL